MFEFIAFALPNSTAICEGSLVVEGTQNEVLAEIFAKQGRLMAPQISTQLIRAASGNSKLAQRVEASGPSGQYNYVLCDRGKVDGDAVRFSFKLFIKS